jgi:uncharacterized protein (DUF2267 family)
VTTTTRISSLDRSLQKTVAWVRDLAGDLGSADFNRAWAAMRAVIQALRDRLPRDEAAHLGSQLPLVIRCLYFEGWDPSRGPAADRTREEFLTRIALTLVNVGDLEPEDAARAVFRLLARRITTGEIEDVRSVLPKPVQELWPGLAETAGVEAVVEEREESGVIEPDRDERLEAQRAEAVPGRREETRRLRPRRGRARLRRARQEIRTAVARARVRGVPEGDLPVLTSRRKLRRGRRRNR